MPVFRKNKVLVWILTHTMYFAIVFWGSDFTLHNRSGLESEFNFTILLLTISHGRAFHVVLHNRDVEICTVMYYCIVGESLLCFCTWNFGEWTQCWQFCSFSLFAVFGDDDSFYTDAFILILMKLIYQLASLLMNSINCVIILVVNAESIYKM